MMMATVTMLTSGGPCRQHPISSRDAPPPIAGDLRRQQGGLDLLDGLRVRHRQRRIRLGCAGIVNSSDLWNQTVEE
jgi:hypothetical protein